MDEQSITRSVVRKRHLRKRRIRSFWLITAATLISVSIGIYFVKPVSAPQALNGLIFKQTIKPTLIPSISEEDSIKEDQETETVALQTPVNLPTQAQVITYPQNTPVLYYAQSGDSLAVLAIHFGVEIADITSTNPLPDVGFIPPGQLLLIPPQVDTTSSSLKLLPDSEVIDSPTTIDFDIDAFVNNAGGYLSTYQEYLGSTGKTKGSEIISRVALEYSINPRLLLTILQHMSNWVYGQPPSEILQKYPMGYVDKDHEGLFKQAVWVAGEIANGYYGWREGTMVALTFPDDFTLRLAPELNSGSVGVMNLFSKLYPFSAWAEILYTDDGIINKFSTMFGDPWIRALEIEPLFTPGIQQPEMILPFMKGKIWALTGGPHAAWGSARVRAAVDFAPPSLESGCVVSDEWVVASASGLVVRSGDGAVVIDLDGDGFEQTGWNIVYFHIEDRNRVPLGAYVEMGDKIGHPSCVGGFATGTHVHIARKYNGEWVPADGPLPFNLSGWIAKAGSSIYTGWLIKDDKIVRASVTSSSISHIQREE